MEFGCAYACGPDAVRQAQVAESLGFDYIGFYDSPALEPDIWLTVAEALRSTQRIIVGPYVLIPHLRTPMAQASVIATLWVRGEGRFEVAMGTGFTGRIAMGKRPLSWEFMRTFVAQLRGLLNGEEVEIDGGVEKMIQPPGYGASRPIRVPLLLAANGPKGIEVAREYADGLVYTGAEAQVPAGFERLVLGMSGFALEDGESETSARIVDAARVMFTLQYHLAYDGFSGSEARVQQLPHGEEWLEMIERFPARTRHLHVHDQHMVGVNAHDHAFSERHRAELEEFASALALTPERFAAQVARYEALGATRVVGGHALPDWERGLRAFAVLADLRSP
jgi:5,10-methylenetetrahydromethanopterin reductase